MRTGLTAVLIPTIGRDSIHEALESVQRLPDHVAITIKDDANNASAVRNRLFDLVEHDDRFEYVRYLDDDDVLLGAIKPLWGADFVTFPLRLNDGGLTPIGEPYDQLLLGAYPVFWCARKAVLSDLKRSQGFLWDESKPCRHGSWFWLSLLQHRPQTTFSTAASAYYEYRQHSSGVSNRLDFPAQTAAFTEAALRFLSP